MMKAEAVSTTRKGDRISISISVQISCADQTGKHFTEVVRTVNVSRSGCCLLLKQSLSVGQKICLQRMGSREEAVVTSRGRLVFAPKATFMGLKCSTPARTSGVFGFLTKRNWRRAAFAYSSNALRAKTVNKLP
jgi:hypothetical protein